MPDPREQSSADETPPATERLESWKEIAAYLRRDVTTVQRWEKREGMPVHRHVHDKMGSVHAFRHELDAWTRARSSTRQPVAATPPPPRRKLLRTIVGVGVAVAALVFAGWWLFGRPSPDAGPLAGASFARLTDFGSTEHAGAISADGRFVAFLSDRDGRMDVWVTQLGTGQFHNLTRGFEAELVNPAVRTIGFTPDGTQVTFWRRRLEGDRPAIGVWSVPVLGGSPKPYLEGVAEYSWSRDGSRLVYHTPGPGDPMFVREPGQPERQIFSATAGLHAHFPVWSPDGSHIYFVQGAVPDHMDIWRMNPSGGTPERITNHDGHVSHPVFAGASTLLYLATDSEGEGPWLYSVEPGGTPRRASGGLERYTSLAASADGRRLVASMAQPANELWRMAVQPTLSLDPATLARVQLASGSGSRAAVGSNYLLYVASKGESDSLWKLRGRDATELWSAPGARILAGAAISPDGRYVAFTARQDRRAMLQIASADGTGAREVGRQLAIQGAPAWAPDGRSLTVTAISGGSPRLYSVPIDGSAPSPLTSDYATDPVWSPDGSLLLYSGPDIGTMSSLHALGPGGQPVKLPPISLSRGARRVAFGRDSRSLVVLRGDMLHKELWAIDLVTGADRQLSNFPADFNVRDFAIAPDGSEIVLERVHERSDIVLINRPPVRW